MSSRKDQKEALRLERERKAAEAASAERRKRMIGFGVAGALVAAAVIALVVVLLAGGGDDDKSSNSRSAEPDSADFQKASIPPAKATNLEDAAADAKCKVATSPSEGRSHVDGHVDYKTNPPTSGNHNAFPAQDGPYLDPPEMEQLVHALEHGRVILWF